MRLYRGPIVGTHHDECADCRFWNLTPLQSVRYHDRLRTYLRRRSIMLSGRAIRYARRAYVAVAVSVAASLVAVAGLIFRV